MKNDMARELRDCGGMTDRIVVPGQGCYDEAGGVFDEMASGLLEAADLTRNLHFQPGAFPQAEDLQRAVEQFSKERQDTLEIYSEACTYVGEIVRATGETYSQSERGRADGSSTLETRIGSALQGLQRLHTRLDKIRSDRPEGSFNAVSKRQIQNGGSNQGSGPGPEATRKSPQPTPAPASSAPQPTPPPSNGKTGGSK